MITMRTSSASGRSARILRTLGVAALMAGLSVPASAHVLDIVLQPSSLLAKGNQALAMGDTELARDYYKAALDNQLSERQRSLSYNGLCVSYIMEENWSEALSHCNQAIRLKPNNWRFYNNRGNIFLEQGDFAKARAEYERGLAIAPEAEVIIKNMAIVELRENAKGAPVDIHSTPVQRYL